MAKAIDGTYASGTFEDKQTEMDEVALSTIILYLFETVLRNVEGIKITTEMWTMLDIYI